MEKYILQPVSSKPIQIMQTLFNCQRVINGSEFLWPFQTTTCSWNMRITNRYLNILGQYQIESVYILNMTQSSNIKFNCEALDNRTLQNPVALPDSAYSLMSRSTQCLSSESVNMAKGLALKRNCQMQMQKNRLAYKDFDKDFTNLLSYLQFILKTCLSYCYIVLQ